MEPSNAKFHIHLGYSLLRLGRWQDGWKEFGWYWRAEGLASYSPWFLSSPRPRLEPGDPVQGKTILVTGWGGVGDLIMFTRLAEHLSLKGAVQVSLHITQHMSFFASNRWGYPIVSGTESDEFFLLMEKHDAWVPNASLPAVLGLTPADIGSWGGYFCADPARRANWRQRLTARGDRWRIGLAWSGNPGNLYEKNRSIPTNDLFPLLLGKPEVDWYIVQKNDRNGELMARALPHVFDYSAAFDDLQDSAALIAELDLVISVDSLPAHLSASLGKPTWLLLGSAADWRWGVSEDKSPWYDSLHIYRQITQGSWTQLLERVANELNSFCTKSRALETGPV